ILRLSRAAFWLAALVLLLTPGAALAAEGGSGDYLPGFGGPLAGMLPAPGNYFSFDTWLVHQSVGKTVIAGLVEAHLDADIAMFFPQFTQVTKKKILGGTYGWTIMVPFGNVDVSASVTGPLGNTISGSRGVFNLSDVTFSPFILGWHQKYTHETFTLMV